MVGVGQYHRIERGWIKWKWLWRFIVFHFSCGDTSTVEEDAPPGDLNKVHGARHHARCAMEGDTGF